MVGVPVSYLLAIADCRPAHLAANIAALRSTLLRTRINIYDERSVALLSALRDVHDLSGIREWADRLRSIARDHGQDCGRALGADRRNRDGNARTVEVCRERDGL